MFRLPRLVTVKLPRAEGEYAQTTFQELFPHIGRGLAKKYKKPLQVQEDLIRAIRKGDVVVVAGPNTGKSQTILAYCCEEVVRVQKGERESFHAFFLTPTNALALSLKEKARGLNETIAGGALRLDFYRSGDDYEARRQAIRERADHHLLFFTPEMLAATLASALSHGEEPWYNYLLGANLIVIDEFDALGPRRQALAIALVRVLKVDAAKQGRELRVALMSATIANPEELLEGVLFGGTVVRGAARHGELTITVHPFAKPGGRRWELKASHFENLLDWIPPLLFYYNKFQKKHLEEFLQKLEYKFTADWIVGETPTTRITNMNDILKEIEKSSDPQKTLSRVDFPNPSHIGQKKICCFRS